MRYSFLEAKITERGIKKAAISAAIGVTPKSFNNKLTGKSPFTWPEVQTIQKRFFPDLDKDDLFQQQAIQQPKRPAGRLPVDDRPALKMAGQGERHENH